jgi:uncharacterized membrane protein YfcA
MPALYFYKFLNIETIIISCLSTVVLMSFMPIGSWLAKSVSKENFDKLILLLLCFIALRIIYLNY